MKIKIKNLIILCVLISFPLNADEANLNNNTENVTYLINRRAYCRFIDSKQIANKNDVKSWS